MEQANKIKLFESRDFLQNFETTTKFIKQNYGAILKGVCFFLPLAIFAGYAMPNQVTVQAAITKGNMFGAYDLWALIGYLCFMLSSLACMLYTVSYMAEYAAKVDGTPITASAIWARITPAIFPLLVSSILYIMLMLVGMILCIIPGLIIAFLCTFYVYTYINEDESVTGCLKRSYELVKGNWVNVFLFLLVAGIITGIISRIASIPLLILTLSQAFNIDLSSNMEIFYIVAQIVSYVGVIIFAPLMYIAMGVQYYSLRAQDEGITHTDAIDNIGQWPVN